MSGQTIRMIALVVVMAAVTCALTIVVQVPVPATSGYIHLGDVAANFAALAFGPWLGALIAGGGMAIADLIAGYTIYAPATLVIHGLQAVVVALVGRQRRAWLMFVAALAGGLVVVVGYFAYQTALIGFGQLSRPLALSFETLRQVLALGWPVAIKEVPFNVIQVLSGLVGVPVYMLVAQAFPPLVRWVGQD